MPPESRYRIVTNGAQFKVQRMRVALLWFRGRDVWEDATAATEDIDALRQWIADEERRALEARRPWTVVA
jgi:hypothetical protein